MSQRRFSTLLIAAIAATTTLGACGSANESSPATSERSATTDRVGDLADAVEVAAGAPAKADAASCTADRDTLELAIEAYALLNGVAPTSQDELVEAQLLQEPSTRYDVNSDGEIVLATGSTCS